jgi:hypothetical protein
VRDQSEPKGVDWDELEPDPPVPRPGEGEPNAPCAEALVENAAITATTMTGFNIGSSSQAAIPESQGSSVRRKRL